MPAVTGHYEVSVGYFTTKLFVWFLFDVSAFMVLEKKNTFRHSTSRRDMRTAGLHSSFNSQNTPVKWIVLSPFFRQENSSVK